MRGLQLFLLFVVVAVCASGQVLGVGGGQAQAHWLTKLLREAGEAGGSAARRGAGSLDDVVRQLKRLPQDPNRTALAAVVTAEGHWTFLNRHGQRFTAANPQEMKHVGPMLVGEGKTADGGAKTFDIMVGDEALFSKRAAFSALPKDAQLRVVSRGESYRVQGNFHDVTARLQAEVRPGVMLSLSSYEALLEGLWQLSRSLKALNIRVLALDARGPHTIPRLARINANGKRALVDRIDPYKLPKSLAALRGQTAVIAARIEGNVLVFRTAGGGEGRIALKDLVQAAEKSDVNLVLLNSRAPRQPGDRNWLWQQVSIDGLEAGLARANMGQFLGALAGEGRRLVVTVSDRRGARAVLLARGGSSASSIPLSGGLERVVAEVVSEVAGRVVTSEIRVHAVSRARQKELDQRILPGISSDLQFLYIGSWGLGFFLGLSVAHNWWLRLWPPEERSEYASVIGYYAARSVRFMLFHLIFLPLVGLFAAVWTFIASIAGLLMLPFRWVRSALDR